LALSEAAGAGGDHKQAIKQARAACELDSDLIPALVAHVRHLTAAGQMRKASKTAQAAWARNPHPDLAAAFGALGGPDEAPLGRVKRFQSLYKARPDHIESRLALAEASLAASLWGEARRYLDGIDQPSARHCRLMAALEEQEFSDSEAARRWRDKAAVAPPECVWICGECGSGASAWTPVCGHCNAFDGLTWRVPPGILPQALAKVPASS
jgi:HemY protein